MLQQNITQAWVLTPGFGGRGKGKDVKRCEVIQTVKKVMTFSFVCVRCCDPVLNTRENLFCLQRGNERDANFLITSQRENTCIMLYCFKAII